MDIGGDVDGRLSVESPDPLDRMAHPTSRNQSLSESRGAPHSIEPNSAVQRPRSEVATRESEQQLEADGALFDRLMWQGFAGKEWEAFRTPLTQYSLRVLGPWIKSGRIVRKCAEHNCPCLPLVPAARSPEACSDLAVETVANALVYFRDEACVKAKWDRTRGATLRTYFIGACLFSFRNVYRNWLRLRRRVSPSTPGREELDPDLVDDHPDHNPERSATAKLQAAALLAKVDDTTRAVVILDADGASYEEIAAELGTTPRAVDSRLYRLRKRLR
jgi:hypothetical protein